MKKRSSVLFWASIAFMSLVLGIDPPTATAQRHGGRGVDDNPHGGQVHRQPQFQGQPRINGRGRGFDDNPRAYGQGQPRINGRGNRLGDDRPGQGRVWDDNNGQRRGRGRGYDDGPHRGGIRSDDNPRRNPDHPPVVRSGRDWPRGGNGQWKDPKVNRHNNHGGNYYYHNDKRVSITKTNTTVVVKKFYGDYRFRGWDHRFASYHHGYVNRCFADYGIWIQNLMIVNGVVCLGTIPVPGWIVCSYDPNFVIAPDGQLVYWHYYHRYYRAVYNTY